MTALQLAVARLHSQGLSDREAARMLGISPKAVGEHLRRAKTAPDTLSLLEIAAAVAEHRAEQAAADPIYDVYRELTEHREFHHRRRAS